MLARRVALFPSLLLALGASACDAGPERLNLILVSLDTCRTDRISCYGAPVEWTPNLERFGREAVRFDDCLANSSLTGPSHMSLFTGQYVQRHGFWKNGMRVDPEVTLASTLLDGGWRTAAFTGHGSLQEKFGHGHGFEVFESWVGPERAPFTRNLPDVVPRSLAWLDGVGRDPFFLLVHGYDPHCPYWPSQPYRERHAGWYAGTFSPEGECHPERFRELVKSGVLGAEETRYIGDLYSAEVAEADRAFGELLDGLDRRSLLERSIVVFTSDHGESLGNYGHFGHGALFESVLRVPLLIRYPGGQWAGPQDAPAQLIDVMPTLLGSLGLKAPSTSQGQDLTPYVRGQAEPSPERLRVAQTERTVSVRLDARWKVNFTWSKSRVVGPGLYDVVDDPEEKRNLQATPQGQEPYRRVIQSYLSWCEETAERDAIRRGVSSLPEASVEDLEMLEALGYAGDGE